ncbi:MAG: hypothetical protein AB1498_08510 [bacterium]
MKEWKQYQNIRGREGISNLDKSKIRNWKFIFSLKNISEGGKMKKVNMLILAAVMMMGLTTLASAVDVKVNGKVDFRYNIGGAVSTDGKNDTTSFVFKNLDLREARLTAKANITDKISAQVSNNFAGANSVTLEKNNTGLGDAYINFTLGNGNLLVGAASLPGIAIRGTILNTKLLTTGSNGGNVNKLTSNAINQVSFAEKVNPLSYAIAIVDGDVNTETGGTSKDLFLNIGADVSGVTLGAAYNLDLNVNDIDAQQGSFYAANIGYALNPVDFKVQYIGGLKKAVTGTAGKDISDPTADAPTGEFVVEVGFKNILTLGYDMFGKSNAFTVKGNWKIAEGVTGIARADILGSKYKDVNLAANNISLGVAAEF